MSSSSQHVDTPPDQDACSPEPSWSWWRSHFLGFEGQSLGGSSVSHPGFDEDHPDFREDWSSCSGKGKKGWTTGGSVFHPHPEYDSKGWSLSEQENLLPDYLEYGYIGKYGWDLSDDEEFVSKGKAGKAHGGKKGYGPASSSHGKAGKAFGYKGKYGKNDGPYHEGKGSKRRQAMGWRPGKQWAGPEAH